MFLLLSFTFFGICFFHVQNPRASTPSSAGFTQGGRVRLLRRGRLQGGELGQGRPQGLARVQGALAEVQRLRHGDGHHEVGQVRTQARKTSRDIHGEKNRDIHRFPAKEEEIAIIWCGELEILCARKEEEGLRSIRYPA